MVKRWVSSDFRNIWVCYCNAVTPIIYLVMCTFMTCTFLTSCSYDCELNISWNVLENEFVSPGKPWNLVFAGPGKS